MTFLKKLGQIIAEGVLFVGGLAPLLAAKVPATAGVTQVISKDLMAIGDVVVQVEGIGAALGLSGADKLRAATGPVIQILMDSELLAGKPIMSTAALNTAAVGAINSVVAMLNAIHPSAAVGMTVVTASAPTA